MGAIEPGAGTRRLRCTRERFKVRGARAWARVWAGVKVRAWVRRAGEGTGG